jgi:hypothetical protein
VGPSLDTKGVVDKPRKTFQNSQTAVWEALENREAIDNCGQDEHGDPNAVAVETRLS